MTDLTHLTPADTLDVLRLAAALLSLCAAVGFGWAAWWLHRIGRAQ